MTRNRCVALAVIIVALGAVWVRVRGGEPPAVIDLVASLDEADRRPKQGGAGLFGHSRVAIGNATRRAIFVPSPTRITWDVTLPNRGVLRTAMGIDPSVWDEEGDGVQFRIAVSVDGRYQLLVSRHLDPKRVAADRGWIPVTLDLSPYSGRRVHLIMATDAGPDRNADTRSDLAYWAAPIITLR